jgi:hypothetical protein
MRHQFEQTLSRAAHLVLRFAPEAKAIASNLRKQVVEELDGMPAEMLAEFFVRNEVAGELFNLARMFEAKAYTASSLDLLSSNPRVSPCLG